jgi:hypothetical protein
VRFAAENYGVRWPGFSPLIGRTILLSEIQKVATKTEADARFPRLMAFAKFWKWIVPCLRDFVHEDVNYKSYPADKRAGR